MEREVRYCTTEDGVRIAYSVEGDGPPLLICSFFFESFSVDHLVPDAARLYGALGDGRTVIRYDPRCVGLSQRDAADLSIEGLVKDIEAVVEAVGVGPVSIYGAGSSVAKTVLYAVRHPGRVEKLALHSGYARSLDMGTENTLRALAEMARTDWAVAATAFTGKAVALEHDQSWIEAYVESASGEDVAQAILANLTTDVTPYLGDVRAPTLVTHFADNPRIPYRLGQELAARIPDASLVTLRVTTVDEWFQAMMSIDSFLPKDPSARISEMAEPGSSLRTVLFTDIVGHTAMMSRLGDERGREVLREHEKITRDVLAANSGTEVKTMGDGFMASFGSVTKSVECAIALQRAFAEREGEPLNVRVGLNAGEPIEEDGDLFGATVILASRIAAKAEGGEILVADTIRGLCSGKGFLFADRGEFVAKGFEDPVRVYEVRWREGG
jgi:class 3 adenylate cyclase